MDDRELLEKVRLAGAPALPEAEANLFAAEIRLRCTQAMLLGLDREGRIAYLLADVMGLSGQEAAAVLELDPATYRKRLSRARARLYEFMRGRSGVRLSFFASAFALGTHAAPLDRVPLQAMVDRAQAGTYQARPVRVFAFESIVEAHRLLESGAAGGKLVVRVDD
jgi:hypothetical protein